MADANNPRDQNDPLQHNPWRDDPWDTRSQHYWPTSDRLSQHSQEGLGVADRPAASYGETNAKPQGNPTVPKATCNGYENKTLVDNGLSEKPRTNGDMTNKEKEDKLPPPPKVEPLDIESGPRPPNPPPPVHRGKKPRGKRVVGVPFRILLFANLMGLMVFGAIEPRSMLQVKAEIVAIAITGVAMFVQFCAPWYRWCRCLPYSIWPVLAADAVCLVGWVASIAVLAYWDRSMVYTPVASDPKSWRACHGAKGMQTIFTEGEFGSWIVIKWCPVEVDGRSVLIGNGMARTQLHAMIGLSSVSLFFTMILLLYVWKRGKQLGFIRR